MPEPASRTTLLRDFRFWVVVILCLYFYNADHVPAIMRDVEFTSIADLLRSIPRHECFGHLIRELTSIVEWSFPSSSPLLENSVRRWILTASRSIYGCTGDIISGSISCIILISFLVPPNVALIYVFITCVICLVSYLKNNRAEIPENDRH